MTNCQILIPKKTVVAARIKGGLRKKSVAKEGEGKRKVGEAEVEWANAKAKLTEAQQDAGERKWDKHCIYRIPKFIQENNKKAYVPQTVSIGPYHYEKMRKRHHNNDGMDRFKWRALHHVLQRSGDKGIDHYFGAVKAMEAAARDCYEGDISLDRNQFVEMMVLDACFLLEIFHRNDELVISMGGASTLCSIQRDVLMLENQIPLFILKRLYQFQTDNKVGGVEKLITNFFDPSIQPYPKTRRGTDFRCIEVSGSTEERDFQTTSGSEIRGLHCLEVFRRFLLQDSKSGGAGEPNSTSADAVEPNRKSDGAVEPDKSQQQKHIHCVTQLKRVGIKFQKGKPGLSNITFKNGILELPHLLIDDGTRSLFLNLMAFEQCHARCSNDVTSYVIFMDSLINSQEDVSYLHRCGIIDNWLGSDAEAADLFNRLCREVVFDINDSSLRLVTKQLNEYDKRHHAWKASFMRTYLRNPWTFISLIAAFVLLVLTFVQTFYTVYAYYTPPL